MKTIQVALLISALSISTNGKYVLSFESMRVQCLLPGDNCSIETKDVAILKEIYKTTRQKPVNVSSLGAIRSHLVTLKYAYGERREAWVLSDYIVFDWEKFKGYRMTRRLRRFVNQCC